MTVRSIAFLVAAFVSGALMLAGVGLMVFPVEAGSGCSASASVAWKPFAARTFRAEAFSNGPNCTYAVVTLVIRAPDGKVLWADAAPADHLMTFVEVRTRKRMSSVLGEWLSQNHMFKTTAELPEWKTGEDSPKSGEFQFIPDQSVDREYYEQARAGKLPVFCYVQGMESMACVVLSKDGQMTKIGVQTFPG